MTTSKIPTLDEIQEEMLDLETSQDRMGYLIELGDSLPPFPPEWCIESNRVLGCQSMVWLVPDIQGDRVSFLASSDAPMVRGLIAILMAAYSGKRSSEILSIPAEQLFERMHLKAFLSPMRSNGLHSMIQRVKQIAMERESQSAGNLAPSKDIGTETNVHQARTPDVVVRPISSIRPDFPILARIMPNGKSLVYLDNAASSHRPIQVLERMEEVQRHSYSNAHRSGHQLASETTMAMEEAREGIRSFLNARDKAEVIFTSGTTASINMVARAWGDAFVATGDEILLSEMEHHSNIVPWQQLAQRVGANIRWIPLQDDYHLSLDQLSSLLTSKTRLVAVTAVSNVLGTINPVREIADRVHAVGAKLLVDAAQAVPHGTLDVQQWDADFVAFGAHKMLGPTGIGVLYGKKDLLEAMPPFFGGGGMIHQVTHDGFTPAALPYRLEAGTPAAVEAIGMLPAIEYLHSLGGDAILQWERTLVKRAEEGLASLKGLRIYGPPSEQRTGILTFTIDGLHPEDIGRWLDAEGIAIRAGHHCAMPLHARLGLKASCRASFYCYNSTEDVDRFVESLHQIHRRLVG